MVFPCFRLLETRELTLNIEEEAERPAKLPTPVLSGSGSRVFSQPPKSLEHPCFNNPIETLRGRFGKCVSTDPARIAGQKVSLAAYRAS
jgi:hypothetical protein